ncbi:MAG: TetR/AcrR family transcriptional regulator [Hyphomicrobiales bacterium]
MARKSGSSGTLTAKAIRQQSLALFASHGFSAVSMRMIADAVGVQPGALYQYHPTKQNILVDLMRSHMQGLLETWNTQEIINGAPEQALEQFVRFHISYHITRPDEVFISYMELRSLEPEGFQEIEALRKRYEQVLKAILDEGISRKVFVLEDAHVAAMAILSMLTGVNTWFRSGGRLSQEKIEDMYVAMVLRSSGC